MNPVPDIFRILPEVILTLTGVAVMLIDASLPPGFPRRPLGWVAGIGTTLALWASLWQLSLPQGSGFFGTVETSAFTIFFQAPKSASSTSPTSLVRISRDALTRRRSQRLTA